MNKMEKKYLVLGIVLLHLLLNPLSQRWLESSMTGYMLVQIPGLIASGYFLGLAVRSRISAIWMGWNHGGIPGLFMAIFTIAFWLLPRFVDAALTEPDMEIWKAITLPLFAGIPLAWSWRQLNPLVRCLVWANLLSMIFVMSWLYLSAPVRLCNNFLENQQHSLGTSLFLVGLALAAYWALQAFVGKPKSYDPDQVIC